MIQADMVMTSSKSGGSLIATAGILSPNVKENRRSMDSGDVGPGDESDLLTYEVHEAWLAKLGHW